MARKKRYKKKDLMLFLVLSVVSILLIIIYYIPKIYKKSIAKCNKTEFNWGKNIYEKI